jgi:hypothetical protein
MRFARPGLTVIAILLFHIAFSQAICGFDLIQKQLIKQDPEYRSNLQRYESNLRTTIQEINQQRKKKAGTLGGPPYYIPVVVHIITTGGAIGSIYNPTDAQIQGAIDYLNAVYSGNYPGMAGVGDIGIHFILAKRDPNCNSSSGIERIDGSGVTDYSNYGVSISGGPGADEISIKNLSRWNTSQYYNIWIVNKIDNNDGTSGTFIAGYAYFPGSPASLDGTVMLATQMITGQKTLPHEIGHAFSLYHPFEGSPDKNTCPQNTNCSLDGDEVCDTDPITYNQLGGTINFSCRTGINSCTGTSYSTNTESNFMNYTNCYNLFTSGQRDRMQASAISPNRIGLTNSTGVLDPSANPSCGPKINFELNGDQVTESTTASSGCRNYHDFVYNMIIGAAPSADAIVTLSVNAISATEGVDFDITTNGDFNSPSKALVFPAGSTASQPFTIRVYDDASVEGTESFSLGFSVNPGGGDAAAGTAITVFNMKIFDNDQSPGGGVTPYGTANIGTIAALIGAGPFDASQQGQRSQFQYTATELTAAGIPAGYISSLSLYVQTKSSTRAFTGLTIKIGKSSVTDLVNGSVTVGAAMQTVKSMASYSTISGWNVFALDSAYLWDGTSNLVIEFCFDNGSAQAGAGADQLSAYYDGSTASQGNMFLQNGINCAQSFSSVSYYGSGRKPIIKFVYGIPETTVASALNASRQEWLGPNTDIYFYDQTTNQLMARIQNSSSFNYGCTQVTIDRAGSSASPFWNNTPANFLMDKTFHVVPTNNNSSGNYIITLYYTQGEVSGWQSATGQSINNTQIVKTANPISSVTPGNPAAGGSMYTGLATISKVGSNTGLTYNFTTGFSGFGAGIVETVLPMRLLEFSGAIHNEHANLHWATASEENSKGFDVEKSLDGENFEKTGFVAAQGSSSVRTDYNFIDKNIAADSNYYRLKLLDLNNQFQYSNIILLKNVFGNNFQVLTNPFINSIQVRWGKPATGVAVSRLLDITGKEIFRNSQILNSSLNLFLDLTGKPITRGIYILDIYLNQEHHVQKLVKQ